MNYKVGTRGSALALVQTKLVTDRLQSAYPEDTFETVILQTTGDRNQQQSIELLGGKGVFTDTLEAAILSGAIDFAVHSMKDMPAALPKGLTFAKAWEREDARDVLILRDHRSLVALPEGAVIASCSQRRTLQLNALRPDLRITAIRGNIDTRLRRLAEGSCNGVPIDGIILAAAGIKRLGRDGEITQYFSVDEMIPSPGQGTLAIELRSDNKALLRKLNVFCDPTNVLCTALERDFLAQIGASCHEPVGAYAVQENGAVTFRAIYGTEDGRLARIRFTESKPENIVPKAVKEIKRQLDG
ncbi:MAG: hydroxymethylbilane synthase [Eubacterium sp.]|nr:hydroxymethylbilane synthase [Eubacterium sp.]